MGKFNKGYENISVKLLEWKGNDLAKNVYNFGRLAEFYENNPEYDENNEICIKVIDEIIKGKTFPKYLFEGHNIAFQINNISRICLAQLTREKGIFCSQSGDVRPLTQEFITPKTIFNDEEIMKELSSIQKNIEKVYIKMAKKGYSYLDTRYFGFHAQTISLTYLSAAANWCKSCNSRTENNFADEINYVYRLMLNELKIAIKTLTDKNSIKLWEWLLTFADKKGPYGYTRDNTYNNDFNRFPNKEGYVFEEKPHNDIKTASWTKELIDIFYNKKDLLLPGEIDMIKRWIRFGIKSTYDKNDPSTLYTKIEEIDYYEDEKE